MKNFQKLLSVLLVLCLAVGMFPAASALGADIYVSASGSDSNAGSRTQPLATLQAAYDAAPTGSTIHLLDSLELDAPVHFGEDKAVSLVSDTAVTVTYTGTDAIPNTSGGLISVTAGSVTVEGITLQLPAARGTNGRVLYVGPQGSVALASGAVVTNGYLAYAGGGALVDGGSLTMLAGSAIRDNYIANNTDCYGGGVSVVNGGTLIMEGGEISGNTIHTNRDFFSGGGGVAVDGTSAFIMTGGVIRANSADSAGGGVYVFPGGTVTLRGRVTISDNTASDETSNLYLPAEDAVVSLGGTVTGSVGLSCGDADYGRVVGLPDGYTIQSCDEAAFLYDDGTYDIRLKDGKLVLYPYTVPVTLALDDVESENDAHETALGEDYDTVLSPHAGYRLPEAITVTVGGTALDGDSFAYDPASGRLHIPGEAVTGTVVIRASADRLYTVTITTDHVSADVDSMVVISSDTVTVRLTAHDRYGLPEETDIAISGLCDHSYSGGVLTLTNISSDVSIQITGSEVYHTLHFDPAPGLCGTAQLLITESQPSLGTLPVPTREGYTFAGWYAGEERVTADTANTFTADLYLTARWAARTDIPYTVQHWLEYAAGGVNPGYSGGGFTSITYGGVTRQYYLYTQSVSADGIADGALSLADRTLSSLTDGLSIEGITPSGANDYAVTVSPAGTSVFPLFYDRNRYTVHYDSNGGSMEGSQVTTSVIYGGAYAVMPSAVREGYILAGWYTDPHGGEKVMAGDMALHAGDLTLYAHWTPVGTTPFVVYHLFQKLTDNTVFFEKSPENYALEQTDSMTGTSDTTVDLYALAVPGFVPSDENDYHITVLPDGSAAAYLYYDRLATDVSFDPQGGSQISFSTRLYYGGTFALFPGEPSRVGYTFAGWYDGPNDAATQVVPGTELTAVNPGMADRLILCAHWTPRTYPLTFQAHGGQVSGSKTVTYNAPVGELPTASLTGYVFCGWYDRDGKLGVPEGDLITADTVVSVDTIISVLDGQEVAATLYAWYKPVEVSLTFDPAPGTLSDGAAARAVTYDKPLGVLPVPVRPGYTLREWHLGSLEGAVLTAATVSKLTEDAVACAEYVPNVYTVTFDPKGGAVEPTTALVTYDQVYGTLPIPVRAGYDFLGWYDGAVQVTDASRVSVLSAQTLTAKWAAKSFAVTFDPSGGELSEKDVRRTVVFDAPYGELPAPTRSGYIFDGWYTAPEDGQQVKPEFAVSVPGDHTLYARWHRQYTGSSRPSASIPAPKPVDTSLMWVLEREAHNAYLIGCPDGTIRPMAQITRAEVAQIFYRLLTEKAHRQFDSVSHPFSDVDSSAWYFEAVSTLAHMGVLKGRGNGIFDPGAYITRSEFAVIASRFCTGVHEGPDVFDDIADNWAREEINLAADRGWVLGDDHGRFRPGSTITRAEVVTWINRMLGRLPAEIPSWAKVWPDNADPEAWYYLAMQEATTTHKYVQAGSIETWSIP